MRHSYLSGAFTPVRVITESGGVVVGVLRKGVLQNLAPVGHIPLADVREIASHINITHGTSGRVLTESGAGYKWSLA